MRQALGILFVLVVGPVEHHFSVVLNPFFLHGGTALLVLVEGKLVFPAISVGGLQRCADFDVRITASGQAANRAHAPASGNGFSKAASGQCEIPKKAKSVERIRLPRSVRADQKEPISDIDLYLEEVLPVLQPESAKLEAHFLSWSLPGETHTIPHYAWP
nr:hypothetical protein [Verrucomicrobium sp. 3C]